MDILIHVTSELHNRNINFVDFIKETFNPQDIYNNGGVVSFDYDNFQIDFIPVKESNWDIARKWFSYDPFSNLTGKVSHKLGLKFSWDGLKFPFRNFNGRLSQDIIITKDHKKAVEFMGYDYSPYEKGFDTVEEIFDYVISSKYFDSEIFQMENLNHIDRKRNKKRKTYQGFLKYINDNNIVRKYEHKSKEEYIELIDSSFPEANLIEKLNELKRKDLENNELNRKFNGKLIMTSHPELKGKELGEAIKNFRNSFEDFKIYGLSNSSEEIMNDFSNFINR